MHTSPLKRTALFEEHQRLNGRLIDFGGWEMPVQYTGLMDEHLQCRSTVGLFDVSHMGEVHVEGPGAENFLNYLVSNDVSKLAIGQAQYTVMCHPHGGIVDDLVIYLRSDDRFLVVVNASNTDKDFLHMKKVAAEFESKAQAHFDLSNKSSEYSQIAIQGSRAAEILQKLTTTSLSPIKTYWFAEGSVLKTIPTILARTGYTGEDGFELYVPWSEGPKVWRALMDAGKEHSIKACGLGARDTLRMEMKYPLYGHELGDDTNPLEAGLSWVVKLGKTDFVGKSALVQAKEKGISRKLVGLKLLDRGIPRQGYPVLNSSGAQIGELTSGTQSPSLKQAIGIAYIESQSSVIGTSIQVEIRGNPVAAQVVETPFYKRPY